MKATRKESRDALVDPGDYELISVSDNVVALVFICPCAGRYAGHQASITFDGVGGPKWQWDGNRDRPTVEPSIAVQPCGWHGFLTAGEWLSV